MIETGHWQLPGGRFHYLFAGPKNGRPILVLHGFPDVPSTFTALVKQLAHAGFGVYAPYLRGYRPSTARGPFSLERLGQDVVEMLTAIGPRVSVVAHDWGALASYQAMSTHPECFAASVLLSVPHPGALLANLRHHPEQLARSWYVFAFSLPAWTPRMVAALSPRLWRTWSPGFRPPASHIAQVRHVLRMSGGAPIEFYRALFRPTREARYRLERAKTVLAVPCLTIHGERDGCIHPHMARDQHRFFAGPHRAVKLAAAGHFLAAERPVQVAELATEWILST